MGWGIGIGIGWPNASAGISYAKKLIKAFKERVLSYPTSIFEAEACLDATLTELNAIGLLKEASLIVTPNAYNEGILYDVVPNTTLGDMTFVRATTATRVNSAGLIEVVPRNFLTYSEQINNAIWIKQSSTIVQNFAIAPNGIGDADLCYPTSAGSFRGFRQASTTSIGLRAKSVFAKQSGKSKFYIRFDDATYVTFDLADGSIFQNTTGYLATIEDYGNGWYRCSATNNIVTSASSMYIGLADAAGYPSVTPNGTDGVLFWGAQDDAGSLTEYFPTTTRLNIPRIDYSNGGCPGILIEPQRTNLLLNSATVATQTITTTATATTVSFYGTGTITFSGTYIGSLVGTGTNNRVTLTFTPTAGSLILTVVGSCKNGQLEAGSYETSYIPTVASTVTRNADVISRNNVYTNGLITSAGGTWFVELNNNIALISNSLSQLGIGTSANLGEGGQSGFSLRKTANPSNRLSVVKYLNGTATSLFLTQTDTIKVAVRWNGTTADVYVNGVKQITDTTFTITIMEFLVQYNIGDVPKYIKSTMLFPTPLTDQECINLTTL
jgi:hypothetical protein